MHLFDFPNSCILFCIISKNWKKLLITLTQKRHKSFVYYVWKNLSIIQILLCEISSIREIEIHKNVYASTSRRLICRPRQQQKTKNKKKNIFTCKIMPIKCGEITVLLLNYCRLFAFPMHFHVVWELVCLSETSTVAYKDLLSRYAHILCYKCHPHEFP